MARDVPFTILIEVWDPLLTSHQQRVSALACAIAREMGISGKRLEGLRVAGAMHDVGLMYIPAEVLKKPSPLNEIDLEMMKRHPQIGYDILKNAAYGRPIAEIVMQHHERMDGSGYPRGLAGKEILLETRILMVADVVEAMISPRLHRPAHDLDRALEELVRNKKRLFDPDPVNCCLKLFAEKQHCFE